jgi:hypothetical protein
VSWAPFATFIAGQLSVWGLMVVERREERRRQSRERERQLLIDIQDAETKFSLLVLDLTTEWQRQEKAISSATSDYLRDVQAASMALNRQSSRATNKQIWKLEQVIGARLAEMLAYMQRRPAQPNDEPFRKIQLEYVDALFEFIDAVGAELGTITGLLNEEWPVLGTFRRFIRRIRNIGPSQSDNTPT